MSGPFQRITQVDLGSARPVVAAAAGFDEEEDCNPYSSLHGTHPSPHAGPVHHDLLADPHHTHCDLAAARDPLGSMTVAVVRARAAADVGCVDDSGSAAAADADDVPPGDGNFAALDSDYDSKAQISLPSRQIQAQNPCSKQTAEVGWLPDPRLRLKSHHCESPFLPSPSLKPDHNRGRS